MLVLALFFLSGVASLVLEVVFRRELTLYVGSAVTATSLTLATFLGGLALGAALFGRIADSTDRPLRLYGLLELGVGLTGALAVALLAHGRSFLLGLTEVTGSPAVAALLLPPTILMGGTLPCLTRHALRRGGSIVGSIATLYGVNTLGASFGASLAGFVLFEALGISASGGLGAALALLVGAVAIGIDRPSGDRDREKPTPAKRPDAATKASARQGAIVIAALSGAVALGYEVVWTRLLVLPLRSYAYSFSLMLSLFLLGLVLGALALARLASRIADPLRTLALVQLASAVYVAASVVWLPFVLAPPSGGSGFAAFVLNGVVRAGPVVLPPTILSGMALPLAVRVFTGETERGGRSVGFIYAVNTLGSIAGALGAGFLLLPHLGASRALACLATLGATAGAVGAFLTFSKLVRRGAVLATVAACAATVAVPRDAYVGAYSRTGQPKESRDAVLFYSEGVTDTVAVVKRDYGFRDPDAKSVLVNGIAMTATVKPVWRYMSAEGHLPALFAGAASRGLVICVGTGITLGSLASHESVSAIDAVDLSEGVLASLPIFDRENRSAARDPKINLVHADGRHFLERSDRSYGLITLEPPPPMVAGSVHLYTRDFYRLCRTRLVPGGVVAQWLPLHGQSLPSAKATARTFLEAFPYVELWLPSIRDAVLIGSDRPLRLDPERLRAAYGAPSTRASLEAAYFETPEALLATYLLDRDGVASWSSGADVITDDRPRIEFFRRYGGTMPDREIATLLTPPPGSIDDIVAPGSDPSLRRLVEDERRAHLLYLRAEIAKDPAGSREAALATRATHFGLYRLGCDGPQLDALRADARGETAWRQQVEMCRALTSR